jgi:ABC-type glycerol-3-phosphate transport system substrate-binding protein
MNARHTAPRPTGWNRRRFLRGIGAATGATWFAALGATTPTTFGARAQTESPIRLRFLVAEGPGRELGFAAVISAYQELHPNVTVEMVTVPYRDFFAQVPIQFASNTPPDIVLADSPDIKNYAYNETIVPLDDLFTAEDLQDFAPSIVSEATYEGQLFGSPWEESAIGIYYNRDYFDAAGVQAPATLEEAWTWQEFVEQVNTVIAHQAESAQTGLWGTVFLNNPPILDYWQLPLVRSNGEPDSPTFAALSPDGSQISGYLDTPDAKEGYAFWQSLYANGFAPLSDLPDAFGTGQAVTMVSFPAWGSIMDQVFPEFNWGVLPLPYLKTPITHTGGWTLVIAAKSRHIDEAKEFSRFVSSPEGVSLYYELSSVMPARQSLLTSLPAFSEGPLELFRDELLEWGHPRPEGPGHPVYGTIVGKLMTDIANGVDIEAAVTAAVQEGDLQLRQFQ